MLDLSESRAQIDVIDKEITRLFQKRIDVCRDVAAYKIQNNKKVLVAALFYASVIMAMLTRRWRFGIAASACVVVICLEYLAYKQINIRPSKRRVEVLNAAIA